MLLTFTSPRIYKNIDAALDEVCTLSYSLSESDIDLLRGITEPWEVKAKFAQREYTEDREANYGSFSSKKRDLPGRCVNILGEQFRYWKDVYLDAVVVKDNSIVEGTKVQYFSVSKELSFWMDINKKTKVSLPKEETPESTTQYTLWRDTGHIILPSECLDDDVVYYETASQINEFYAWRDKSNLWRCAVEVISKATPTNPEISSAYKTYTSAGWTMT